MQTWMFPRRQHVHSFNNINIIFHVHRITLNVLVYLAILTMIESLVLFSLVRDSIHDYPANPLLHLDDVKWGRSELAKDSPPEKILMRSSGIILFLPLSSSFIKLACPP
ncbi:hypothetical protein BO85DRAFT_177390 [Aspergillus piperis CBS 112811]|uniref:Uncharacterized protein n=1 Tax=Aspergillus piperis CBS 112811 TaxID=1448313 RepID=A0A8G1VPA6_9EURO|nr:hypothetical protein BO85DRAFT_177390 [Aspergillus piperis CBS 112811]RAH60784.1 hypothetical protein BO85DRAFT_177390 [Aspergillus piperis CBS 112811]